MSKPGPKECHIREDMTILDFKDYIIAAAEGFCANIQHLQKDEKYLEKTYQMSNYEWFYTFGFWLEALEYRDEYPEYFEEWELLKSTTEVK